MREALVVGSVAAPVADVTVSARAPLSFVAGFGDDDLDVLRVHKSAHAGTVPRRWSRYFVNCSTDASAIT